MMTRNPVPVSPVRFDPPAVPVVVAFDPDPSTVMLGAYLDGSEKR